MMIFFFSSIKALVLVQFMLCFQVDNCDLIDPFLSTLRFEVVRFAKKKVFLVL